MMPAREKTMHAHGLPDPVIAPGFYEGVPLKRLVAWVADSLIVLAATLVAVPLTGFVGLVFLPLLWLTMGVVYRVATLSTGSATPGMRLVGIELRDRAGAPLDTSLAVLHTLGYTAAIAFVPVQAASIILMLTGARGQGLVDHVLGTAVINRPDDAR